MLLVSIASRRGYTLNLHSHIALGVAPALDAMTALLLCVCVCVWRLMRRIDIPLPSLFPWILFPWILFPWIFSCPSYLSSPPSSLRPSQSVLPKGFAVSRCEAITQNTALSQLPTITVQRQVHRAPRQQHVPSSHPLFNHPLFNHPLFNQPPSRFEMNHMPSNYPKRAPIEMLFYQFITTQMGQGGSRLV